MYLVEFQANFAVFRVFLSISRDFADIPEFRGSATRLANTKQRLKSKAIYMYVRLKNKKLLEGLKGFLIMIIVLTKF